jgi:hypothetical protein
LKGENSGISGAGFDKRGVHHQHRICHEPKFLPNTVRVLGKSEIMWNSRQIKEILKKIPFVAFLYYKCIALTLKWESAEAAFTEIFVGNKWGGRESVSGLGSDLLQTRVISRELPTVCADFDVHTILDIPCGDFHWMQHVSLEGIDYTGADIVTDLIQRNIKMYHKKNVHFQNLNLMKDKLPKVDLILCRDCLVHFSYEDIFLALNNICDSGSTYLLATTFPGRRYNYNITTGQWRALNMELAPIMFPPPCRTINEECTENDGAYKDKSLGLWRVADIRERLKRVQVPG